MAKVVAVCVSDRKGVAKKPISQATAVVDKGLDGDAHAGEGPRQVSLLADESAQTIRDKGAEVGPGDFGENILTQGIDLVGLPIGAELRIGDVILEVTQIGKECHTRCAIYYQAGTCVMPKEGIFCRILAGGVLRPGMTIHDGEGPN
jgi:MOSC domain-containing protein YiiM